MVGRGNNDIRARDSKLIIGFSGGERTNVKDCWNWGTQLT